MRNVINTFKFSFRLASTSPMNAILCILVLAGSIALVMTMFSVSSMIFLSKYPYRNVDRMVFVAKLDDKNNRSSDWGADSYRMIMSEEHGDIFDDLVPFFADRVAIRNGNNSKSEHAAYLDAQFESKLGIRPILGRTFNAEDAKSNTERVVIIGEKVWKELFGQDPEVCGKILNVDGIDRTVIGVMPQIFECPSRQKLWMPFNIDTLKAESGWATYATFIGTIKEGLTIEEANRRFELLTQRIIESSPGEHRYTKHGRLIKIKDTIADNDGRYLFGALMICSVLVLLMGCGIVSGLLTARYSIRTQEIAIRSAMGASRTQLVSQMVLEFSLLSGTSLIIGLLIKRWLEIGVLQRYLDYFDLPLFMMQAGHSWKIPFAVFILILTTLASTLLPAMRASKPNLISILRESTRTGSSLRVTRLSNILIIWQVATATVMLCGVAIIGHMLHKLNNECIYFDPSSYMSAQMAFNPIMHSDDSTREQKVRMLMERLLLEPMVDKVAVTTEYFGGDGFWGDDQKTWIEGHHYASESEVPMCTQRIVTPGYFNTMNIPIIAGREFSVSDSGVNSRLVIVTDQFAKRYFNSIDVIGKHVAFHNQDNIYEIIGVVPESIDNNDNIIQFPALYVPYASNPWFDFILVSKGHCKPMDLELILQKVVSDIDSNISISSVMTLKEMRERNGQGLLLHFVFVLFTTFSIGALLMAASGLYGVISFSVNIRNIEMGIRLALGADPRLIISLLVSKGLLCMCAGLGLGIVGSYFLREIMRRNFNPLPESAIIYASTVLALLVVCTITVVIPAFLGATNDPSRALRSE